MAAVMTTAMMAAQTAYQRGRWFVSSISEIRIIWNITLGHLFGGGLWGEVECAGTSDGRWAEVLHGFRVE
jgi:hypothetical protein